MNGFEAETTLIIHSMFAHSGLHMPVEFSKKFSFDVLAGAKPQKWFNNNIIKPLKKVFHGIIWNKLDYKDNLKRVFSNHQEL